MSIFTKPFSVPRITHSPRCQSFSCSAISSYLRSLISVSHNTKKIQVRESSNTRNRLRRLGATLFRSRRMRLFTDATNAPACLRKSLCASNLMPIQRTELHRLAEWRVS
jgi:hypothetical protein